MTAAGTMSCRMSAVGDHDWLCHGDSRYPTFAGEPPMAGIFISYRREDTKGEELKLFENLKKHFGADRVFMDVITIRPVEDFRKVIDSAVASCDVLITLIGKEWLQRLTGARDFVRMETATALKREVRVIPVLVQGAAMPTEEALPV